MPARRGGNRVGASQISLREEMSWRSYPPRRGVKHGRQVEQSQPVPAIVKGRVATLRSRHVPELNIKPDHDVAVSHVPAILGTTERVLSPLTRLAVFRRFRRSRAFSSARTSRTAGDQGKCK